MGNSLVIIPTYNEKENVASIIDAVMVLDAALEVLIVDDGSPDGTADIVKQLISKYPNRLHIEERKGKLGLGTAYIHGFKWALQRHYEYIMEMDADFSHPPHKLLELKKACEDGADFSIGSRYIKGGKVSDWPFTRWMISYGASLYVRIVLWMNIMDTTAGFVCYKRKVLETINFDEIKFIGYAFQIEMKYAAHKLGFKHKEVPITFQDRKLGNSKMSMNIFNEAFYGVIKMRSLSFKKSKVNGKDFN
jgi:dolichol-phosphate mannosyltransferase